MQLSIVTTLYRSSAHLAEFCVRAEAAARAFAGDSYEIVLVNDGSPDDSLCVARAISKGRQNFTVVNLSRNFGHHKAIMAGLTYSRGEFVYLIDCDLEEDPAWLQRFHNELRRTSADVVYGVQIQRKGRWLERISGAVFWRIFSVMANIDLPANIVTARLMSRSYVNALLQHRERELFLAGLFHITGFRQTPLAVAKQDRGESTYTMRRKIALLVNAVTSFSSQPLFVIFYSGIVISILSALYIGTLGVRWLFLDRPPTGWTSLIASIWLLGGLTISFLGVIGIYIAKIFSEVKQRPTIIRSVYRDNVEVAAGIALAEASSERGNRP